MRLVILGALVLEGGYVWHQFGWQFFRGNVISVVLGQIGCLTANAALDGLAVKVYRTEFVEIGLAFTDQGRVTHILHLRRA